MVFFEGEQNKHAVDIIKNFCKKVGFRWRFGIGIGAGEFMRETQVSIPLNVGPKKNIYKAFQEISKDIEEDFGQEKGDIYLSPKLPRTLFFFAGNRHWVKESKLKNIDKKRLYAKPYEQ